MTRHRTLAAALLAATACCALAQMPSPPPAGPDLAEIFADPAGWTGTAEAFAATRRDGTRSFTVYRIVPQASP